MLVSSYAHSEFAADGVRPGVLVQEGHSIFVLVFSHPVWNSRNSQGPRKPRRCFQPVCASIAARSNTSQWVSVDSLLGWEGGIERTIFLLASKIVRSRTNTTRASVTFFFFDSLCWKWRQPTNVAGGRAWFNYSLPFSWVRVCTYVKRYAFTAFSSSCQTGINVVQHLRRLTLV